MINSRAKGARGERAWAAMLSKYGFESRRAAQNGVDSGLDVQGDIPGWRGEVKHCAKAEWGQWVIQACDDAQHFKMKPYVAWKPPRRPWRVRLFLCDLWDGGPVLVTEMDGEDFLKWMSRVHCGQSIQGDDPCVPPCSSPAYSVSPAAMSSARLIRELRTSLPTLALG